MVKYSIMGKEAEAVATDEMQRFLDREALRGTDELDAWRALAQILGIIFPTVEEQKDRPD